MLVNESSLYGLLYYTENPDYYDLIHGIFRSAKWYYSPTMMNDYSFPEDIIFDFFRHFNFPYDELASIFYLAVFFTITRYAFEKFFCQVRHFFVIQA